MALSDDEHDLIVGLDRQLSRSQKELKLLDLYLEGEQPLKYMAPQLEAEVGDLVTQLVINWPMLVVDAYEHRLDIVGFRYAQESDRDQKIWEWWDQVDGEMQSQMAHFEALGLRHCFAVIGSGDDDGDPPVLTIEHPMQIAAHRDPKTRRIREALKEWVEDDKTRMGQLYTGDATVTVRKDGRKWVEEERDDHELGEPPVVAIVHKPRLMRPEGRSVFQDIIPIADAANKMATDMMVSGEFHAMPRRWALGFSDEDFVDEHGKQIDTWSQVWGRVWSSEKSPQEAAVGQFTEADLRNFHETIKLLAQMVGQLVGLPQDYLSFSTDNPPSAESRRAAEVRLIKGAERICTQFGGSWEQVARLFLRFDSVDGELPDNAASLKTVWRDPATPTRAQQVDSVVKLVETKLVPLEQGRIDLGYDEEQRRRMREMDEEAVERDPLNAIAEQLRRDGAAAGGGTGDAAA